MIVQLHDAIKLHKILYQQVQHASHYENTPIQIYRKFHHRKLKVFR